MFYQLPPAGNPVCLSRGESGDSLLREVFHPFVPQYYASGTTALAASIIAAVKLKGVADPEVILPAYGCPDLVSAALFSGAKPVLVDLEPDRPWMDLDQVSGNTNAKTVAIIAASLCGIPERMDALRQVAETCSALLIEDSAQAFPCSTDQSFWQGDLVVLSFGRGKPVSMLGGGAVLYRDSRIGDLLPVPDSQGSNASVIFRLQAMLYNRMLSPRLYWLPQSLPFLHLGETRFHSLDQLTQMDEARVALLPANIEAYQGRPDTAREAVAGLAAIAVTAGDGAVDL
ncbi:MAG: DegT/DnrJ/EryC1/StrS family aminotransferase, partial [Gammaproteobacteria bacterium]|nr:DegT/DnrJ/EryC1/StrS family aminotransferase [Gammaproteobacteria bacterium]